MSTKRKIFQGVLNILSFNRHFYVFGLIALTLIILSKYFLDWNDTLYWLTIASFAYGLVMPLIVSAYVYDFSGFYNFDWLKKFNIEDHATNLNLNINAGFDETSFIINSILPNSQLQVYDFYNETQHTEPAIVRARKVSNVYPNTKQINSNAIPLADGSANNIFLISAIHEIRSYAEKVTFLKECRRVCKTNGKIIMVEHLRDFPNFVAFTIGFTHFFSSNVWRKAFNEAGYNSIDEKKFTPFMSVYTCS